MGDSGQQRRTVEDLLRTVARCFYDDAVVVVVDALIRDGFWKTTPRGRITTNLRLSNKQLRKSLVFLLGEHWTNTELVNGVVETVGTNRTYRRKQSAEFWYLDYNRAVHSIRLRLHLLQQRLNYSIVSMTSNSTFYCPNCQAVSTELEVQSYPLWKNHFFLCFDCHHLYEHHPDPPDPSTYALQTVDYSVELRDATDTLRRLRCQLSSKDGQRRGIYDQLAAIQNTSIITSNLPSDNGAQAFLGTSAVEESQGGGVCTQTWYGQPLELFVQDGASFQALMEPNNPSHPQPTLHDPPPLPKPSLCRQTTPYFLKRNFGRPLWRESDEDGDEGKESSSKVPEGASRDDDEEEEIFSDNEQYARAVSRNFVETFSRALVQQNQTVSTEYAGDVFVSTGSCASVAWQEG